MEGTNNVIVTITLKGHAQLDNCRDLVDALKRANKLDLTQDDCGFAHGLEIAGVPGARMLRDLLTPPWKVPGALIEEIS
jgi:hypothetical protein